MNLQILIRLRNIFFSKYICLTYSTKNQIKVKKNLSEKEKARYFVDFRRIHIFGGKGGNGCLSFLSLYANEWAGPDGGDGGNGGHIIFEADTNTKSLAHLKSIIKAESGGKGLSTNCFGHNAKPTVIKVPLGTYFRDEEGVILTTLVQPEDTFLAARGGAGGKGNKYFLSNENRAPTTYEEGGAGEEKVLFVEMRIMAHFGLVGFPNAGKSLLLRSMTNAKPKVAAYPFTTLRPHVGILQFDNLQQVAIADIPGMMEGAHVNRGLGCNFLRHITRCTCLLFVIDLSATNPSPIQQLLKLKYELEHYDNQLLEKPHLIIANKIDLAASIRHLPILLDHLRQQYGGVEVMHELPSQDDDSQYCFDKEKEVGIDKLTFDIEEISYDRKRRKDKAHAMPWFCKNEQQIDETSANSKYAKVIVVSAKERTNLSILKHAIRQTFDNYIG